MAKKTKRSQNTKNIINRFKNLRKKMRMTQRQLADEFYVTPGAIAHWENGDRSIPGPVRRLIEIYEDYLEVIKTKNENQGR